MRVQYGVVINHLHIIASNHSEFEGGGAAAADVVEAVDIGIDIGPRSGSDGVMMENDVMFSFSFVFVFLRWRASGVCLTFCFLGLSL